MKTTDIDLEEAAAESEQDRRDHRKLAGQVELLLQHEDAMRVPIAVRRLIDAEIDPLVVAKTLAIGDRAGPLIYRMTTKVIGANLGEHEQVAVDWVSLAIRDIEPDLGTTMMISGAVWIASQFGIAREVLVLLVTNAAKRPARDDRRGYGVVDLVDHHAVGDRASVVTAIGNAQLPMFAPLVGSPWKA